MSANIQMLILSTPLQPHFITLAPIQFDSYPSQSPIIHHIAYNNMLHKLPIKYIKIQPFNENGILLGLPLSNCILKLIITPIIEHNLGKPKRLPIAIILHNLNLHSRIPVDPHSLIPRIQTQHRFLTATLHLPKIHLIHPIPLRDPIEHGLLISHHNILTGPPIVLEPAFSPLHIPGEYAGPVELYLEGFDSALGFAGAVVVPDSD